MTPGQEQFDVYRLSIWVYENKSRKMELDRMAAMLSRPGGRGCQVRGDQTV